jgi:hypothetical protein
MCAREGGEEREGGGVGGGERELASESVELWCARHGFFSSARSNISSKRSNTSTKELLLKPHGVRDMHVRCV